MPTLRKRKSTASDSNVNSKATKSKGTKPSKSTPTQQRLVMILSPAKTLNLSPMTPHQPIPWTVPSCNLQKTKEISQILKRHSKVGASKLSKVLGISAKLAETAKEYWDDFGENHGEDLQDTQKPCIFAFSGAAYQGLSIHSVSPSSLTYLQDSLRIVDPLYGWLRPMDVMQPYRLEMATKNLLPDKLKLADYWKPAIAESIQEESPEFILNLASDEYSAAVSVPMIKVVFRHGGRVIAVHAKRARGLMVRFLADHQATTLEQVTTFDQEGYLYQENLSNDTTIVFDRSPNWNK